MNPLILSDEYIPKKLLHREEELDKIRNIFVNFKKFKIGSNMIIFGVSGSGKTCLIKKVIHEFDNSLFVSGNQCNSSINVLKKLFNIKEGERHFILESAIKFLKNKPHILVIDELDKVYDFKRLVNDLNFIYRKTMCPVIIITCKRNILSKIEIDALKTLFFEKLRLVSYKPNEIRDIINDRINLLGINKSLIPVSFAPHVSACATYNGSCRLAINLLLRCLQNGRFDDSFVDEVFKDLVAEDWVGFYYDLNKTERDFLMTVSQLCDYNKETNMETLNNSLKKMGYNLSLPRLSQIVTLFEKYSAINSRHKNTGRLGGRKRFIKFSSKEAYESIIKLLDKDK